MAWPTFSETKIREEKWSKPLKSTSSKQELLEMLVEAAKNTEKEQKSNASK